LSRHIYSNDWSYQYKLNSDLVKVTFGSSLVNVNQYDLIRQTLEHEGKGHYCADVSDTYDRDLQNMSDVSLLSSNPWGSG
jgi:hypothetical protein